MKSEVEKKVTLLYLMLVILIDFMGMAMVVVIFPKLLLHSTTLLSSLWVYEDRIKIMGVLLAIYPLGQIIGASIFGKLSDNWGRKELLLITIMGTSFSFMLSAFSIEISSLTLLLVSRLVTGLFAGNVAIAQASLLDISTPETRAQNISYSQIAMGSAYIVGPVLGGWLTQAFPFCTLSTPFWIFSLALGALLVVTIFLYKETLSEAKSTSIDPFEFAQQIVGGFANKKLRNVFIVWLLFVSGWWLFESFMPAFLSIKFGYDTVQIGNLLAFNGALYASFQFIVVQRIAKYMNPTLMVIYSSIFAALSIMALSFVVAPWQLYLAMSVFVMAMGFSIPGIVTFISNNVDDASQGQVMGIVNSIQAVSTVLVMLLGGYLNSININISVIGGGLLVLISWLMFTVTNFNRVGQLKIVQEQL